MKAERVAHWMEIVANVGVIVTLVLLILQVRDNTRSLEGQAILQRGAAFTDPFLSESEAPSILAKIKTVDGSEPAVAEYMARYGLSYEEGSIWLRHVLSIWTSLEAEYVVLGPSAELEQRIRILLPFPDQEVWFENGGLDFLSTRRFADYLEHIRSEG